MGPSFTHADFCPLIVADAIDCDDVYGQKEFEVEVFGIDSKCLDVTVGTTKSAVCLKSECNTEFQTFDFEVENGIYSCSKDYEVVDVNVSGTSYRFNCPRLAQVCPK